MGELRRSYIVIEDMSLGARRSFRPFDEVETAGAEPPNLSISQADLSQREAHRLRGEPGKTIAPNDVEMFLMEPVAGDGGPAGDVEAHAEWGLKQIGALETEFTGEGVTVAVLDTGIDATHSAFAGVTLIEQDFSGSGNGDRKGHGTHCAGTIFGRPVDGSGSASPLALPRPISARSFLIRVRGVRTPPAWFYKDFPGPSAMKWM